MSLAAQGSTGVCSNPDISLSLRSVSGAGGWEAEEREAECVRAGQDRVGRIVFRTQAVSLCQ